MKREEKFEIVQELAGKILENSNFYITDVSDLSVQETVELRKLCFANGIELKVSKNTFIIKALKQNNLLCDDLEQVLKGPSSLMFCENVNAPAKLIKEFRKKYSRPVLKAAYLRETLFIGDDKVDKLINLKSKEELLGDLIFMLNSPIRNLIGALNGGGQKIMGVLETLQKKE